MTLTLTIDLAEAKAKLSALLDRAAEGDEIVVTRDGRPMARIVGFTELSPRQPGVASHWEIDEEALLAPTAPDDLDWANGEYTDEFAISLPRRP